jgi:hypothetical protein
MTLALALGGLIRAGMLLRSEVGIGQVPTWRRLAGILAFAALVIQAFCFSSLFWGHASLLDAFGILRVPILIVIVVLVCTGSGLARWWTLASYVLVFAVSFVGSWDV